MREQESGVFKDKKGKLVYAVYKGFGLVLVVEKETCLNRIGC